MKILLKNSLTSCYNIYPDVGSDGQSFRLISEGSVVRFNPSGPLAPALLAIVVLLLHNCIKSSNTYASRQHVKDKTSEV